uniref:hypothetical protein n=1 Tax=Stappia sp. TaxID=1870903 RepID=UPI003BAB34DD
MKKPSARIPLVAWRDGRPRYQPSPTARARGERGQDLKHADGAWYTFEEASEWSRDKRAEIASTPAPSEAELPPAGIEAPAFTPPRLAPAPRGALTLAHVVSNFTDKNPRMQGQPIREGRKLRPPLAAKTAQYYRDAASLVRRLDRGNFWLREVEAFNGQSVALLLDRVEVCHGLAQARAVRAMLSVAFGYAVQRREIRRNPVKMMEERLPVLPPRVRYGSVEEINHLVSAARLVGRPEIGDMTLLGVWTGQRQADRLSLTEHQIEAMEISFRQAKKSGQPILMPIARALKAVFEDKAARRKAREAALREAGKPVVAWTHVNLDERANRPFKAKHYQHVWREVANAAAWGVWRTADGALLVPVPETGRAPRYLGATGVHEIPPGATEELSPMPSLTTLRDQDLRDTAVTWLARAGADKFEVASMTGHSLKTIDDILEHYFGLHPDLARRAIGKLEAWHEGAEG